MADYKKKKPNFLSLVRLPCLLPHPHANYKKSNIYTSDGHHFINVIEQTCILFLANDPSFFFQKYKNKVAGILKPRLICASLPKKT